MTKNEVLKLALKTLEYAGPSWIDARQPAITAIKEALAQPEQEYHAVNAVHKGEQCYVKAQPEQPKVRTGNCLRVGVCASEGHKIQPQHKPLTDEEIRKANHHMVDGAYDYSFKQGVKWAEYKHGIKGEA